MPCKEQPVQKEKYNSDAHKRNESMLIPERRPLLEDHVLFYYIFYILSVCLSVIIYFIA
jgi:hypothetical protein